MADEARSADPFQDEYRELREIAGKHLRRYADTPTWQATALVHEVYLKLARSSGQYADRAHFLCTAAKTMRHILLDHARDRHRLKRGGQLFRVTLNGSEVAASTNLDVESLDDALERLQKLDARQSQIVELRFFVGLSVEEIAELLDISERSVKRDWAMARAWLQRALAPGDGKKPPIG